MSQAANRLTLQSPLARLARMRTTLAAHGHQLQAARLAMRQTAQNRFALGAQRLQLAAQNMATRRMQIMERLTALEIRLIRAEKQLLTRQHDSLLSRAKLLSSLGYKNVLARGYAVVRAQSGDLLASAKAARGHTQVNLEFHDGILPALLQLVSLPASDKAEQVRPAEKPAPKVKPPFGDQGSFL